LSAGINGVKNENYLKKRNVMKFETQGLDEATLKLAARIVAISATKGKEMSLQTGYILARINLLRVKHGLEPGEPQPMVICQNLFKPGVK
jgi:hypothetical protein